MEETYEKPSLQHPQVLINFRGDELRLNIIAYLERELKRLGVNVYVDGGEVNSGDPENLSIKGIEESQMAIVIFSKRYSESSWCLDELVKIKERVNEGKLVVIPIFYRLNPSQIKGLDGDFGSNLWNLVKRTSEFDKLKKWKDALDFVSQKSGMVLYENNSNEITSIADIVDHVKRELTPLLWDAKSDVNSMEAKTEADIVQTEVIMGDSFLGEANSDATSKIHNSVENKRVDTVNEEKKQEKDSKSSIMVTHDEHPPQYQVFISFRGAEVRTHFVSHLLMALKREGVNVFSDGDVERGLDIGKLLNRIEDSRIALVIFSKRYSESSWCLEELVKIKERMEKGKLLVIPVFYKVEPSEVKLLKGDFGVKFWNLWRINRDHHIIKWKEALQSVASMKGMYLNEHSSESEVISLTVKEVLERISLREGVSPSLFPSLEKGKSTTELPTGEGEKHENYLDKHQLFGIEQRMEQLEKKLDFDCKETRIIGVVGMPGIGKTTLARLLHKRWSSNFIRSAPLLGISMMSKEYKPEWLRKTLLEVLLEGKFPAISEETTHESLKMELLKTKIFVVLDDVNDKKQLEFLLYDLHWIKKGSKIVITTCDKSLLEGFANDTYLVPKLNDREAFQLFSYHAFDDHTCSPTFLTLSRMFVDYAQGHPLALNLLGRELRGKDKAHWEFKLATVTTMLQDVWRFCTDQLNELQKDVFLDIMFFFKSEDEYFVRCLLDSGRPDSNVTVGEVRDLANKFLITISAGRVEMNDMLYNFCNYVSYPRWLRLWNFKDINKLKKIENSEANNVRGIFLNTSKLTKSIYLDKLTFIYMHNLRYLKIYDSSLRQCEVESKLCFPDGLKFPLKAIRYLHWLKFPLEELPPDFRPENLVDLRLPYSKIKRVWEGVKDTPRLKWIDLSHSSKLLDLSALSKAENLQRLNLESCTSLVELPVEIQSMKSLVFLNLRGCISLCSLPNMNLTSLKTLILSGCTNLKEFQLISETIEVLHLDGTAITRLPLAFQSLGRLVVLNLKNCKMLECLPNCLGELKALEELILSGCSKLNNVSDVRKSMKHLQSLLIDRIGAKEMPKISSITTSKGQASADIVLQGPSRWLEGVDVVSCLRRLSLAGNNFDSLETDIWKLYNLNWLDVKDCKMLRSIPMLPPKLQYFDAHGCDSLQRVANPLALPELAEKIHATFNFSNCNKLDQDAKDSIISYTRWKSQLVLDSVSRDNEGSVSEIFTGTCFPGWEVPAWFSHQVFGSVLNLKMPTHWCDKRLTGIALCAVILLAGNYEQRSRLFVKCNCEFKFNNEDVSLIRFSYTLGSWSKPSNTSPSHVFIGYTSMMDIKKHSEEKDEEGCSHTEASFEFQVTDGTKVLEGCKVLECGFNLVYATTPMERFYSVLCNHPYPSTTTPNLQKSFVSKSVELLDRDEAYWQHEPRRARQIFNMKMRDIWNNSIDQLNEKQKDVFLDIVYFFKSEDEYFVRSLLDSGNPETMSEVRDLADKFLITICCGRVEMHDQVYELGKNIGSSGWHRLHNYKEIINKLAKMKQQEDNNVRGIFLDMSEIKESIALECMTFANMRNLLFLKIYDSRCSLQCKADCNLYFPDGLDFPLKEVRYLHWVKFPFGELPLGFIPENLVDLRLPYSQIKRIWESVKDTPRLKRVDLSYSSKLHDLSSLSKAENLQRLNLEGCTNLDELPVEIGNMKSLIFLNLRGCIRLWFLPKMNLISLKTLILSDCSNLKEFQIISESVQFLHLDGTSIKGLPPAIQSLQRLVVLNLKNCKILECLPDCIGNLNVLEKLILSGCSRLKNLPNVRHSLKHLQILLLDGTGIKETPTTSCFTGFEGPTSVDILKPFGSDSSVREWPCGINGVSSLRRLCLSGNDFVSLQPDIAKLYNLMWLDVKQCKKLRFVPMLPPRLQYFDAYGCESLERVANPLALPVLSTQIHATFNFSHCNKLDQDAKDNIMSYIRWRSQLVLDELTRYNGDFALEASIGTCFPGWEVPAWFSHRVSGSVLEPKLLPHWCVNKFTGIALCAVLVFAGYHDQRKRVIVKCNCELKNEDGSSIQFSCNVGGWSEASNASQKIESSHVFIGYTSKLDINIHSEEDDQEGRSHNEASFEFYVTDGTKVLESCEVLKCGFSFLYATDELQAEPGVRGAPVEAKNNRAYSKNVPILNVREDTETLERLWDDGCKTVELPNKMIAREIATTPQPPITKTLVPLPEYGTGPNNVVRERDVQALDLDTRLLSRKPPHLNADLIPVVEFSSQAGLLRGNSQTELLPQDGFLRGHYQTGLLLGPSQSKLLRGHSQTELLRDRSQAGLLRGHSQAGLRRGHSQVVVSFHGARIGRDFVKNLVNTLKTARVNVYEDCGSGIGLKLKQLYTRKEEPKIAVVIFSKSYLESKFSLNDLVMMDKLAKEGNLLVIPVFYNVRSSDVENLEGEFGRRFKEMRERYKDNPEKVLRWETSLKSIAKTTGIHSEVYGKGARLVEATAKAVQRLYGGEPNSLGGGNNALVRAVFEAFIIYVGLKINAPTFASTGMLVGLLVFVVVRVVFINNNQHTRTNDPLPSNYIQH